tara:strand:- start:861 stop:1280 length:420 start_codon:yes stop_codon:yes gene_type:complete
MTTENKNNTIEKNAALIKKLRAEIKALKAESAKDTITIDGAGAVAAHGNVIHQLSKEVGRIRKAYLAATSRKEGLALKRVGLQRFASLSLVIYNKETCTEGQLNDAIKNLGIRLTVSGGTKNAIIARTEIFPMREFTSA